MNMSLLNVEDKPAWPPSPCKEYLLDYFRTAIVEHPKGISVYYKCQPKIQTNEIKLITRYIDKPYSSLACLNLFEEKLNIRKTTVKRLSKDVIFTSDKIWAISPPMLSLYGLLIRSGEYYKKDTTIEDFLNKPNRDSSYLNQAKKAIETILQYGWEKVFGTDINKNWISISGSDIHMAGICSFSSGWLKSMNPEWYKFM